MKPETVRAWKAAAIVFALVIGCMILQTLNNIHRAMLDPQPAQRNGMMVSPTMR